MINSDKHIRYIDIPVSKKKVIPDMRRAFPDDRGIFLQDFVPCHSSKKVETIFRKHKLNVLEWLEHLPDLNPIG